MNFINKQHQWLSESGVAPHPDEAGKSCPAQELHRRAWTPELVASRLALAFKPHHRALPDPTPPLIRSSDGHVRVTTSGDVAAIEDDVDDLEHGEASIEDPDDVDARSDFEQLCCKKRKMRDLPWMQEAFIGGTAIRRLADGREIVRRRGRKANPKIAALIDSWLTTEADIATAECFISMSARDNQPDQRDRPERDRAREFRAARRAAKTDPSSFGKMIDGGGSVTPRPVNDELLAIEAWDWIVEPFADRTIDAARIAALHWLKSGNSLDSYCRRHKLNRKAFARQVRAHAKAQADRLNKRRVRVADIVWDQDILVGLESIADFLGFTAEHVELMIAANKIAVSIFDRNLIAFEPFIRHARAHRKHASA